MCLALGLTRAELRAKMTVEEFADWKDMHRVEPWGEPAKDERTRILASVITNCQGGETTTRDFDFSWEAEAKPRERILIDPREGLAMLANVTRGA